MATTTIGSTCAVSSSDSSNEDENSRFLEAAVLDCHHSTHLNGKVDSKSLPGTTSPSRPRPNNGYVSRPSLRPSKQETHEAENELNTTPDFRAFVGKKLSRIIDGLIEINDNNKTEDNAREADHVSPELGVRLFSSSLHPMCLTNNTPVRNHVKKRPVESSSSDSSEDERLAAAAVSHEFIFKDIKPKETVDISKQSDLPGSETLQEGAKKKEMKHKNNTENYFDSGCPETVAQKNGIEDRDRNQKVPRCKKKKKKKDKCFEEG